MRLHLIWLLAVLALVGPASAQHRFSTSTDYDSTIPTPRSVLGYEVGERFTPHHLLMRYLDRLAAASERVRVDTVGYTFEGREIVTVVVSRETSDARLAAIRADAARLADPRGAGQAELDAVVARHPAIAWLGFTVHGGEASGMEAAIALLYQLAAGTDAETQMVLDSVVVLINPVQNPDGHERHVQDVMRARGALGVPTSPYAAVHQGNWPGSRTSHYQFDLNRDWFVQSHPESRARVETFLTWWPHVAVDLHEMGSNATYFFPPPMAPIHQHIDPNIAEWWDIYAEANAAAFDAHGWSFFRRENYDEFYPGYADSWPTFAGAVGMTYEQASSRGGAIRRSDGTVLTLRDATHHHYTTARATVVTTARHARARVRDFLAFRQRAAAGSERASLRTVVVERDAQGRADSLARRLMDNGIEVGRLREEVTERDAIAYGSARPERVRFAPGSYVVDLAQPQGRLARTLLEPDARLDSAFVREEIERRRTGQSDRFYDVTAWALPYTFRVRAWGTASAIGPTDPVSFGETGTTPVTPASYGYAFAPGSETSMRLLAALLADSVRVRHAPRGFRTGQHHFPQGAFIVRVQANGPTVHDLVARRARESGARVVTLTSARVDEGSDLGSNSVFPVRPPRVALVGGAPMSAYSFGYAWYALDQRIGYPTTRVDAASMSASVLDEFDVLVVPSASASALNRALGSRGRDAVTAWVKGGGRLVTLDGATAWLASDDLDLARIRLRRDSTRADSAGGAPLPVSVPGAIVRVTADTLSPLLAGIADAEFPVLVTSDRVYHVPDDLRAGEAVVRYADSTRLRVAGYLWPEASGRLSTTPYLWTERVERGRVIGFTGEPNFRDMWRGLLPLFANAVLLGGSF